MCFIFTLFFNYEGNNYDTQYFFAIVEMLMKIKASPYFCAGKATRSTSTPSHKSVKKGHGNFA